MLVFLRRKECFLSSSVPRLYASGERERERVAALVSPLKGCSAWQPCLQPWFAAVAAAVARSLTGWSAALRKKHKYAIRRHIFSSQSLLCMPLTERTRTKKLAVCKCEPPFAVAEHATVTPAQISNLKRNCTLPLTHPTPIDATDTQHTYCTHWAVVMHSLYVLSTTQKCVHTQTDTPLRERFQHVACQTPPTGGGGERLEWTGKINADRNN